MRTYDNHRGFTLIELSIVLVIIGMLVGLGANLIGPLTTFVKVRETRDLEDAAIQSITSWASTRNTIPNTSDNADGFKNVAKSPNDAWGREMAFMYYSSLRIAPITKDTICGRRSTPLTLKTYENTTETASVSNVVFAVVSGADNATFTSRIGTALGTSALITNQRGIAGTNTIHVIGPNSDLVRWVTLDELRSKIGCQGAPLKIVNNELPVGSAPTVYSVTLTADGGVPFTAGPNTYKWCVSILPAGFNVPTGGIQNADCAGLSEQSGTWGTASAGITISFPAATVATGAYKITVVARDNADSVTTSSACNTADSGDNCAQKLFVLTVNPQ